MKFPLQVTFRNMGASPDIEAWVQDEAQTLETFYSHIMNCRVAVGIPHRHHRKGKQCQVRIDLTLPQKEIVIKREPAASSRSKTRKTPVIGKLADTGPHPGLRLAIHDAFKAAGRRVQDFARIRRGQVKNHQSPMEMAV